MSDTPDLPNGEAEADHQDADGLDAAAAAFAAQEQQPADTEDEAAETEATDAEEADPEAEDEADDLVEWEHGGKTYKVPPELQKGYLRQSDYSRKMNEVAEQGKRYESALKGVETLTETAGKYADALAQVRMIETQLAAFEKVDWHELEQRDASEAARLAVRQMQLQQRLNQASAASREIGQSVEAERAKVMSDRRAAMHEALSKQLKGWGDEMGTKLTGYAVKNGVSIETLQNLTDPAMVIALDKAKRYDELQASKAQIKSKSQPVPQVVKPGGQPVRSNAANEAMARLRKSNSVDDAAAAWVALDRKRG